MCLSSVEADAVVNDMQVEVAVVDAKVDRNQLRLCMLHSIGDRFLSDTVKVGRQERVVDCRGRVDVNRTADAVGRSRVRSEGLQCRDKTLAIDLDRHQFTDDGAELTLHGVEPVHDPAGIARFSRGGRDERLQVRFSEVA